MIDEVIIAALTGILAAPAMMFGFAIRRWLDGAPYVDD